MKLLLLLASLFATDASASVCSNFVSFNGIAPITCDGTTWLMEVHSDYAAQLNGYNSCNANISQPGPEFIIPFDCPYDGPVDVTLGGTDCDVDLYVLAAGCNPAAGCLGYSAGTGHGVGIQDLATIDCQTGETRYIVVEGYELDRAPANCPWDSPQHRYRMTNVALMTFCDEQCGDGDDNDGDLLVDCGDPDCGCVEDCSTPGDEDGDLAADCNDLDCLGDPLCCDDDDDTWLKASAACGGNDCNDRDNRIHPTAAEVVANGVDEDCSGGDSCYRDGDRDGYGTSAVVVSADLLCSSAQSESSNTTDCADTVAGVHPNAAEVAGDGVDQNCDGVDHCYRDVDRDTYGAGSAVPGPSLTCDASPGWASRNGDCRDSGQGAASAHAGATEVCDGIDNDCDTLVDGADPDVGAQMTVYPDGDGDGYGVAAGAQIVTQCSAQAGFAALSGDCDDANAARSPGLVEVPYDGVDQDCSGADLSDIDADGFPGPVGPGRDCNEQDPLVHPGRAEVPDGVDQDCDGEVDQATTRGDDDGDGFSELGGDCDDAVAGAHPGATEACDGVDNDCDGARDEHTSCSDDDLDGWSEDGGDCNDADNRVNPGWVEAPGNGLDDNCDGFTDQGAYDLDHDGFSAVSGDCNDNDPAVSPVALEVPNGIDDDCNRRTDEGTDRFDDDGDGFTEVAGDCWDQSNAAFPGAVELSNNGVDDDCDGRVDEVDRFGDADRDGWTVDQGDCDDAERNTNPAEAELADGVDNDCDGEIDDAADDADADGFTAAAGDCDDAQGWASPDQVEVCDGVDNNCDGASDEGCVAEVPDRSGACANTASPGALGALVGLMALLRRRRR